MRSTWQFWPRPSERINRLSGNIPACHFGNHRGPQDSYCFSMTLVIRSSHFLLFFSNYNREIEQYQSGRHQPEIVASTLSQILHVQKPSLSPCLCTPDILDIINICGHKFDLKPTDWLPVILLNALYVIFVEYDIVSFFQWLADQIGITGWRMPLPCSEKLPVSLGYPQVVSLFFLLVLLVYPFLALWLYAHRRSYSHDSVILYLPSLLVFFKMTTGAFVMMSTPSSLLGVHDPHWFVRLDTPVCGGSMLSWVSAGTLANVRKWT